MVAYLAVLLCRPGQLWIVDGLDKIESICRMIGRKVLDRFDVWWIEMYERWEEWLKEKQGGQRVGFGRARVASKVKSRKP
jgi:hypothetical protein